MLAVVTPSPGAGSGVTTMLEVATHGYPGGGGWIGAVTVMLPSPSFTAVPEFSPQPAAAIRIPKETATERHRGIFVKMGEAHFFFEKWGAWLIFHLRR